MSAKMRILFAVVYFLLGMLGKHAEDLHDRFCLAVVIIVWVMVMAVNVRGVKRRYK